MVNKMKKLILIAIFATFFFSCTGYQVQPVDPICPMEDSWICEQSEKIGVNPETVYGWVFSAAAIAAVSDIVEVKEICDFEQEIADFYVREYPISYASFVDEAIRRADFIDEPEKAILIKNILNQNLLQYHNPELISNADDMILRRGHAAFRKDMLCYE